MAKQVKRTDAKERCLCRCQGGKTITLSHDTPPLFVVLAALSQHAHRSRTETRKPTKTHMVLSSELFFDLTSPAKNYFAGEPPVSPVVLHTPKDFRPAFLTSLNLNELSRPTSSTNRHHR
jgi:hypothetical protein